MKKYVITEKIGTITTINVLDLGLGKRRKDLLLKAGIIHIPISYHSMFTTAALIYVLCEKIPIKKVMNTSYFMGGLRVDVMEKEIQNALNKFCYRSVSRLNAFDDFGNLIRLVISKNNLEPIE